mmetsp:Transcript_22493/g.34233  ORF Transcript_22493/g.34233 Transcript_22493/m.34233 type:complete len:302 (+) Transcript_22493:1056-1961(+)
MARRVRVGLPLHRSHHPQTIPDGTLPVCLPRVVDLHPQLALCSLPPDPQLGCLSRHLAACSSPSLHPQQALRHRRGLRRQHDASRSLVLAPSHHRRPAPRLLRQHLPCVGCLPHPGLQHGGYLDHLVVQLRQEQGRRHLPSPGRAFAAVLWLRRRRRMGSMGHTRHRLPLHLRHRRASLCRSLALPQPSCHPLAHDGHMSAVSRGPGASRGHPSAAHALVGGHPPQPPRQRELQRALRGLPLPSLLVRARHLRPQAPPHPRRVRLPRTPGHQRAVGHGGAPPLSPHASPAPALHRVGGRQR